MRVDPDDDRVSLRLAQAEDRRIEAKAVIRVTAREDELHGHAAEQVPVGDRLVVRERGGHDFEMNRRSERIGGHELGAVLEQDIDGDAASRQRLE